LAHPSRVWRTRVEFGAPLLGKYGSLVATLTRNPFAALWGFFDPSGIFWLCGEVYEGGKPLSDYFARLPRHVAWTCDPSGKNERLELKRIEANVIPAPGPRGNLDGPGDQGRMRIQNGGSVHDLGVEGSPLPDDNVFLPLGLCQRAGRLVNEDGRGDPFMDLPQVYHRHEATPGTSRRP